MISARDNSNAFLMDKVRGKERMRTLMATAHLIDDEDIEVAAYYVVAGVVWTAVLLVWLA